MTPASSHPVRRLPSPAACLAGVGVLVTLATAFILLRYACPAADDLARGGTFRFRPWYREIAHEYLHETAGRWSGIGLAVIIHPLVDLVRWYPALLTGLAVVQALGLRAFWRMLLGEAATRQQVLGLTATMMAVLWAGLPSPAETWYWMSSGWEYFLSIYLSLLLISGLVRSRWEELSGPRARARTAAFALLGFFVTGLHELIAAMLLLVLVPGTAIALKSRQAYPRRRAWLAVCLSASIGFAVIALAPGNVGRARILDATHPEVDRSLSHTLALTWSLVATELPSWVFDVRLLSATLVLVLSPFFARARAGGLHWGGIPPKLVVIPAWLLGILAMFMGPISVFHAAWTPPRTLSATYMLFVLGWITTVFVYTRPAPDSVDAKADALQTVGPRFARSVALGILGLSLITTGNTRDAIVALGEGVPQTWHRMVHWRDRFIRRAVRGGATELVIPMADLGAVNRARFPKLLWSDDLSEDPHYWINYSMQVYYGLGQIRRAPRGSPLSVKFRQCSDPIGLKSAGGPVVK